MPRIRIQSTIKAILDNDDKRLNQALSDLASLSATQKSEILPALIREGIYADYSAGVRLLLDAGAKPCVADLSVAIRQRNPEIVKQVLSPEVLEKLAGSLSEESFHYAFKLLNPHDWNRYNRVLAKISSKSRSSLQMWMSTQMPDYSKNRR